MQPRPRAISSLPRSQRCQIGRPFESLGDVHFEHCRKAQRGWRQGALLPRERPIGAAPLSESTSEGGADELGE